MCAAYYNGAIWTWFCASGEASAHRNTFTIKIVIFYHQEALIAVKICYENSINELKQKRRMI